MSAPFLSDETLVARARRVKMVCFDVDGVLTDGRFYYGPTGEALHAFHARDGMGLALARKEGLVLAAITGRVSQNVHARLSELGVPHIQQGIRDKIAEIESLMAKHRVTWDEVAYIGDDVNDIEVLQRAGLSCCVPDAADGVSDHVHWVTRRQGGHGALRDMLEGILRAQDKWGFEAR